ncbi:MAG: adenine phosphoribosyltransferase [Halobacteriales archaeon]|nr:adenine phosphoribosyltransferase [Halobacteriales archaeon]
MDLRDYIRSIENFPRDGISFKDITPLLADPEAFENAVGHMAKIAATLEPDIVVSIESRGFIFGAPISLRLGVPFVPIRKEGKLPHTTNRLSYDLEYGTDVIEIHRDAITPGQKVVLVDDIIATGGTAEAALNLIESMGAEVVGVCVLMEITKLRTGQNLDDKILSVMKY